MDFPAPKAIVEAITARAEHGIFGYTRWVKTIVGIFSRYPNRATEQQLEAITKWFERRHNWNIKPEWILFSEGAVPIIFNCVKAFTKPGERVR
jgi:cystathionine beta-lyase